MALAVCCMCGLWWFVVCRSDLMDMIWIWNSYEYYYYLLLLIQMNYHWFIHDSWLIHEARVISHNWCSIWIVQARDCINKPPSIAISNLGSTLRNARRLDVALIGSAKSGWLSAIAPCIREALSVRPGLLETYMSCTVESSVISVSVAVSVPLYTVTSSTATHMKYESCFCHWQWQDLSNMNVHKRPLVLGGSSKSGPLQKILACIV